MSDTEIEPTDPGDPPAVPDQPGPWDEFVNRAILLAPWVAALAIAAWFILTGSVTADITLGGEINTAPVIYGVVAAIGLTYVLALMKFYGTSPVAWIGKTASNYNPPTTDEKS